MRQPEFVTLVSYAPTGWWLAASRIVLATVWIVPLFVPVTGSFAAPPQDCVSRFVGDWEQTTLAEKHDSTIKPDGTVTCYNVTFSIGRERTGRCDQPVYTWTCDGNSFVMNTSPQRWRGTLSPDGTRITGPFEKVQIIMVRKGGSSNTQPAAGAARPAANSEGLCGSFISTTTIKGGLRPPSFTESETLGCVQVVNKCPYEISFEVRRSGVPGTEVNPVSPGKTNKICAATEQQSISYVGMKKR